MTEAEWEAADLRQLERIVQLLPDRQQRLLVAGFCRVIGLAFSHPTYDFALMVAEERADGVAKPADMRAARQQIDTRWSGMLQAAREAIVGDQPPPQTHGQHSYMSAVMMALSDRNWQRLAIEYAVDAQVQGRVCDAVMAKRRLYPVYRDVCCKPTLWSRPRWRTAAAVGIAQAMYDARDFAAMPILADALQDAGCEDDAILGHCRGDGPHVRGCWVVDLVLGRA